MFSKKNLDEIMQQQQANNPQLNVPFVLVKLIDDIIAKEGLKTEGIFRIPAMAEDIRKMKSSIDAGCFEFGEQSVHTSASVLKLWLRELKSPLIPESLYEESLKFCADPEAVARIKMRLPPINRQVIDYLLNFFQKLFLPSNLEITKMTPENIAMIFSPCFLRSTSDDIQSMVNNSRLEATFLFNLIEQKSRKSMIFF